MFSSCTDSPEQYYNELYIVTNLSLENDSVIKNKSSQFHSQVEINGFNQIWNKKFFKKTYETLDKPTYHYYDSIKFISEFNKEGELVRINNWDEILLKVEEQVAEITNGEPVTDPKVQEFIDNYCLDSNLIVNKNIREIMLFNIGYSFILDSISFKKDYPEYMVIHDKDEIILRATNIDVTDITKEITPPILNTLEIEGDFNKAKQEVQIVMSDNQITRAFLKTRMLLDQNNPISNELYLTIER